ncbi:MAG TPA: hypothetical protein VKB80_37360 [Kofleriaceae bacterium]|nr:hypothetical protein [Kofleriaceae bacterium]
MDTRFERALGSRRAAAAVIVLAMAIAATSIAIGFATDDHAFRAILRSQSPLAPAKSDLFRFVRGDPAETRLLVRTGHLPWWSAPDLRIHFLRPLTSLAFAADDRLFGDDPLGYHLVSLAWYLALLIAVACALRRLLAPPAATLALAVFAMSAAHVQAYAWISARHVAVGGALAAVALALALRGGRRARWIALVALAAALAGSEAALAVVPLWIALELAAGGRPVRARLLACLPVAALAAAYLAAYSLLGGGASASGGYCDPLADPLRFAALALVRIPVLLGDAALGIPAELAHVVPEWLLALAGAGAVGFIALAWRASRAPRAPDDRPVHPAGRPDRPGGRALIALGLGGLGATVLGVAGFPDGRVLVVPDIAFAALLGLLLHRGLRARWPGRALVAVVALAHLVLAPLASLHAIDRLAGHARATEEIAREAASLASPSRRLFLVAASDPMVFLYPRAVAAGLTPGAIRCWSVLSAARAGHRLTRTGERTVELEPVGRTLLDGSFDRLFRAPDRPFAPGETIQQCGAAIRVVAVVDGRPARLAIEWRRSLDDPALVLVVWRGGRLERLAPPRIGETIELPWSPGPSRVL